MSSKISPFAPPFRSHDQLAGATQWVSFTGPSGSITTVPISREKLDTLGVLNSSSASLASSNASVTSSISPTPVGKMDPVKDSRASSETGLPKASPKQTEGSSTVDTAKGSGFATLPSQPSTQLQQLQLVHVPANTLELQKLQTLQSLQSLSGVPQSVPVLSNLSQIHGILDGVSGSSSFVSASPSVSQTSSPTRLNPSPPHVHFDPSVQSVTQQLHSLSVGPPGSYPHRSGASLMQSQFITVSPTHSPSLSPSYSPSSSPFSRSSPSPYGREYMDYGPSPYAHPPPAPHNYHHPHYYPYHQQPPPGAYRHPHHQRSYKNHRSTRSHGGNQPYYYDYHKYPYAPPPPSVQQPMSAGSGSSTESPSPPHRYSHRNSTGTYDKYGVLISALQQQHLKPPTSSPKDRSPSPVTDVTVRLVKEASREREERERADREAKDRREGDRDKGTALSLTRGGSEEERRKRLEREAAVPTSVAVSALNGTSGSTTAGSASSPTEELRKRALLEQAVAADALPDKESLKTLERGESLIKAEKLDLVVSPVETLDPSASDPSVTKRRTPSGGTTSSSGLSTLAEPSRSTSPYPRPPPSPVSSILYSSLAPSLGQLDSRSHRTRYDSSSGSLQPPGSAPRRRSWGEGDSFGDSLPPSRPQLFPSHSQPHPLKIPGDSFGHRFDVERVDRGDRDRDGERERRPRSRDTGRERASSSSSVYDAAPEYRSSPRDRDRERERSSSSSSVYSIDMKRGSGSGRYSPPPLASDYRPPSPYGHRSYAPVALPPAPVLPVKSRSKESQPSPPLSSTLPYPSTSASITAPLMSTSDPTYSETSSTSSAVLPGPRLAGTCEWFDQRLGFGFIIPDDLGDTRTYNDNKRVFMHMSGIRVKPITVKKLDRVEYYLDIDYHRRVQAIDVVVIMSWNWVPPPGVPVMDLIHQLGPAHPAHAIHLAQGTTIPPYPTSSGGSGSAFSAYHEESRRRAARVKKPAPYGSGYPPPTYYPPVLPDPLELADREREFRERERRLEQREREQRDREAREREEMEVRRQRQLEREIHIPDREREMLDREERERLRRERDIERNRLAISSALPPPAVPGLRDSSDQKGLLVGEVEAPQKKSTWVAAVGSRIPGVPQLQQLISAPANTIFKKANTYP